MIASARARTVGRLICIRAVFGVEAILIVGRAGSRLKWALLELRGDAGADDGFAVRAFKTRLRGGSKGNSRGIEHVDIALLQGGGNSVRHAYAHEASRCNGDADQQAVFDRTDATGVFAVRDAGE